jgi:metallo-beta-lactamase class B
VITLFAIRFVVLAFSIFALQSPAGVKPPAPINCADCAGWNRPQEPFKVYGNTYYVGVAGLSAVLVTSSAGHILLDGGLPQSAALIDANVRKLGFKTEDVRLILNSHAHFDHSGGISTLQQISGAEVAASGPSARALQQGYPTADDPQHDSGRRTPYPSVTKVRIIRDGEVLRVGDIAITAHFTPGHTPGSTTFSWQACEAARCVNVVYADSLTAVSDDGFRFSGSGGRASVVDAFRRSIDVVEQLPCDILLTVHPGFAQLSDKAARLKKDPATNPFIEAGACRAYAADARKRLEARVATELTP